MAHDHRADSSGVPWEGREFAPNPHAGDDGLTPPAVAAAVTAFRDGSGSFSELAAALAESRALIPLVTHAGDDFDADNPEMEDKVQELAVVTVAGPSGEKVLPVFTSVESMRAWNRDARPVPIEFRRVCLAAAAEGAERVVVNPGTDQIVVRRPTVWAIAQGKPVVPAWESDELRSGLRTALADIDTVSGLTLAPGDPTASGNGPELVITIGIVPGLSDELVADTLQRVRNVPALAELVSPAADSLHITAASIQ